MGQKAIYYNILWYTPNLTRMSFNDTIKHRSDFNFFYKSVLFPVLTSAFFVLPVSRATSINIFKSFFFLPFFHLK